MTTIENLRAQVLNLTLENCIDDPTYNDNTLHDLIFFGFKGLANMTRKELQSELDNLKQWRLDEDEYEDEDEDEDEDEGVEEWAI